MSIPVPSGSRCCFGLIAGPRCEREATRKSESSSLGWCDEHYPPVIPIGQVCVHGSLVRQCQVCELAAEVRELRAELHTARMYLERWLSQHSAGGDTDPCGVSKDLVVETKCLLGVP